jgi:hypothetical protein
MEAYAVPGWEQRGGGWSMVRKASTAGAGQGCVRRSQSVESTGQRGGSERRAEGVRGLSLVVGRSNAVEARKG